MLLRYGRDSEVSEAQVRLLCCENSMLAQRMEAEAEATEKILRATGTANSKEFRPLVFWALFCCGCCSRSNDGDDGDGDGNGKDIESADRKQGKEMEVFTGPKAKQLSSESIRF